ncbi:hypothetical protein N801_07355 [Knoellia aerolata DSM 18566]|uniref:Uncharacterized protein n=1 Tax=Knoellia aerolata DSM 18566 TaxID=1385519 RepID=A0A0A0JXT1_9MICO|nr:hypothetical protein N801_07355 [Knoellia aerolata DSM 18566]
MRGGTWSGVGESVGPSVTRSSPGDEVCGMKRVGMGAHAEGWAPSRWRTSGSPVFTYPLTSSLI